MSTHNLMVDDTIKRQPPGVPRCGLSIGTLTADDAERILGNQGVKAETAKKMHSLVQQLETAVYAGNQFNDADAVGKLLDLVKLIEKDIS